MMGFTFFNEFELVALKLEEVWNDIDVAIIVESPLTFSGLEKPYHFYEHRHDYKKYFSKIHYVQQPVPLVPDPWVREKYQRDVIADIARELSTDVDDVLINSDMDEIVSSSSIQAWRRGETDHVPTSLEMNMYYYFLNNRAISQWCGGKIMRLADLKTTLSTLRYDPNLPIIRNGGWHFSFLGGVNRIKQKVLSYAHNDLYHFVADTEKLKEDLRTGRDCFSDRNLAFCRVPIDDTYPAYIRENLSIWNNFIMPEMEF